MTVGEAQVQKQHAPQDATARQIVGFSFYRLDPAWRRLPASTKRRQGDEIVNVITRSSKQLMVLTYSLVGLKPDVDFLIWRVGASLEQLQERLTQSTQLVRILPAFKRSLAADRRSFPALVESLEKKLKRKLKA